MKKHLTLVLIALSTTAAFSHANEKIPVSEILDKHGLFSNPNNFSGTVDFSGFHVLLDPCKGPVFSHDPQPFPPGWNALGSGIDNNAVAAIAIIGSDVYIGGTFINVGGNTDADRIVRWDGSNWNALDAGLNGGVWVIVIDGNDVYVGGEFTNAGGNPNADGIARWDGNAWNALSTGLNGDIFAIASSGSDVYVGGTFSNAGGNDSIDRIARWDGSTWHPLGSGFDMGGPLTIAVSGSDVYVGGGFLNAGGNDDADGIARWDGSAWHALGTGLNNVVNAIAISGSDVYAGGLFTNAGGNNDADRIARWDGGIWNALGTGLNNRVFAIAISGSDVYVGGIFTNAGGNADADRIARWNGSIWSALGTGINNNQVAALVISGSDVYVGGGFINAGGNNDADRIARWDNTPLSVELIEFEGFSDAGQVKLTWTTAAEMNNDYFIVEHSVNAAAFANIGKVQGKGTTSEMQVYRFTHKNPAPGANYYRLKQMDYDGTYEYSGIINVKVERDDITILPNPSGGLVIINGIKPGQATARISDMAGRFMQEKVLEGDMTLDLANLPDGTYFLTIQYLGQTIVRKIIKEAPR